MVSPPAVRRTAFAVGRTCAASAACLFLLTGLASAQDSQFFFDANGNLLVQATETGAPPQIIGQPQNRIVAPGEATSFFIVAVDTRALTYEWRFNGVPLGGNTTNDALLLQNVSTNNEGEYRVVLTNPSGSVTSAPALLWIDSDADGLPDSWELAVFGNLTNNATADFDHDGSSNFEEYLNGTDPANSNSVRFRLTVLLDSGSVLKSPDQTSYTNGQSVTLTASAFSNETFHAWLGDVVTRSNPVTLVMTNNKSIQARFTPIAFVWTNGAGSDWNSATNWTPNLVPGSNDSVVIVNANVTLNTAADCADFTLGGVLFGAIFTGSGTLTIRGNFLWTQGLMTGSGRTVIEAGGTLKVANSASLVTRTLENGGTVFWTGGGDFSMSSGAVITNRPGALFHVQNAASLAGNAGAGRFDNAGTFRKSADSGVTTVSSGISFNNSGAVEIQTGTLRLAGGGTNTGTFDAPASTLVEWTGGSYTLNFGAQLNGAGLYRINNATLTANTDFGVEALDLIAGTLNGTGTVTVNSGMNWTDSTMSGSGRTLIQPGATLSAAFLGVGILSSRVLENGGTILWSGAGNLGLNSSAVLTNRPGALFEIRNAASINSFGGGRFDNAGTVRKAVGGGTATIASGISFNNSGAVDVQAGTLSLGGGGADSGTFTVSAGAGLALSGGTHALDASSSITGAGQLAVSGGTANLGGLVNVSGSNTFSGGTANLTGNYICANNTLTISGTASANFTGPGSVAPAVLNLSSGTMTGSNLVTVSDLMNWTGGTMSGSGRTILSPGATLNAAIPSLATLSGRTLENGGTIAFTGSGNLGVTGNAVITNRPGALFRIENESTAGLGGSANGRLDNGGTFRKSAGTGTSTVVSGLSFNNSGTVEVQTGTLLCNGGFTNNGAVTLSAGTTNRLAGGGSATGVFTTPAAALVEWTGGTFTLNPGAQLNGNGLYKLNGGSVTANASLGVDNLDLIHSSSTLGGTGAVTVASAMNWTAGTMSGSGRTIISVGATLNAAIPSLGTLTARTLENGGTSAFSGSGNLSVTGNAVITNRPGALFRIENESTAGLGGGIANGRFDNSGTFRKSAGTATTTMPSGMRFTNYNTVDIRSGILAANGGYASSSNALLNCALGGTTAGTGYGQLQVAGTVNLNGALSVDLLPGFSPATNDTFTVLSAGARNNAFASFSYPSNRVTMLLSNAPSAVVLRVTDVLPISQPVLLTPELAGPDVKLTWTATSNVTYRLEFNPGLTNLTGWTALAGDVTTLSNTATKLDSLASSNRFYRVRIIP